MRIFIDRRPWSDNYGIYLTQKDNGTRAVATEIIMKVIEDNVISEPSFFMSGIECQELIDELWQVGFRPTEGTGSAGALSATQKHLEDMRRLVFDANKS